MSGRVVLVTGASRGLGRAILSRFAAGGDLVFGTYRQRAAEAAAVVAEIEEGGGTARFVRADVRDVESVKAALAEVRALAGPVEVLINNAAVQGDGFLAMATHAAFAEALAVNLTGAALCAREVVRGMMSAGRGTIVNVSSVITRRGSPGMSAYAAAKGGLEALTRALALELGPRGIRVNAVVPGAFDAGMTDFAPRAVVERWREGTPLGRLGRPEELAAAVWFLASAEAGFITGHTLVVDGGLSL